MRVALLVGELHGDVAVVIHTEETVPPCVHAIELRGLVG
jgi:hypothetical protein